jgi:hypothetical protein
MTTEKLLESVISELRDDLSLDHGPYYFFGSLISVNQQMVKTPNANNKYPAVILFNEIPETDADTLSHYQREADITLYFMTLADPRWSETDHIDNAVSPMHVIMEYFIDLIGSDSRFGEVENKTVINRTNWGLILQNQSTKKNVFPDFLSGVEIKFTLKVKRDYC